MSSKALCSLLAGAALALSLSAPALAAKAPQDPVEKRFDSIERQLRQIRQILLQSRETGQPVSIRILSDPDPVVEGINVRVEDLEGAARTRNEQIDTLALDLQNARKEAAEAKAQVQALNERLAQIEGRVRTLSEGVAAATPAETLVGGAASPAPGPAPEAVPGAGAEESFRRARQLLLEGRTEAASSALADFVEAYGDTPNAPEARFLLGETQFVRQMYADAAASYIGAIRGWPQVSWAPDAVVNLSRSLIALGKTRDACNTLNELNRRYPNASQRAKTRAAEARMAAACA